MEEQRSNLTGCECKVFSATKAKEREGLGDEYNRWYKGAGKPEIETVQVKQ